MTKKLQHWFALSEKGAKALVRAVLWCFVCNLALMLPVGAVLFTIQHLLSCLETGGHPHGWVLALCRFCVGSSHSAVRPPLVPVRLPVSGHLPGECQPPGESGGDPAQAPPVLFRHPGSQRPDLHHDRRLLQPGPDVLPLCAPALRLHRLHAGDRGGDVPLRLAYGPGSAVGGAGGGGADGGLQKDSRRIRNEKHPEQAGGGRLHSGGAGDHPGHQGLPPAGAVS